MGKKDIPELQTDKQVAKVTKANVFKKTCIISKINLDGTVDLEFK